MGPIKVDIWLKVLLSWRNFLGNTLRLCVLKIPDTPRNWSKWSLGVGLPADMFFQALFTLAMAKSYLPSSDGCSIPVEYFFNPRNRGSWVESDRLGSRLSALDAYPIALNWPKARHSFFWLRGPGKEWSFTTSEQHVAIDRVVHSNCHSKWIQKGIQPDQESGQRQAGNRDSVQCGTPRASIVPLPHWTDLSRIQQQ